MSDFGSGYATCLREFMFHRARLEQQVELWRSLRAKPTTPPGLFTDSDGVESWANGASDHLYELHRPRRGVPRAEWQRAKRVQDRALDIGHGFRPSSKSNPDEARGLLDAAASLLIDLERRGYAVATLDEAMETDRRLGLSPDAGRWSCAEDIWRTGS
jgi:hypothetical protein